MAQGTGLRAQGTEAQGTGHRAQGKSQGTGSSGHTAVL